MQIYCGTDIIEVQRIKDAILSDYKFKNVIFTQNEINYIEKYKDNVKYQHYAGRFAAKEAVFKALSKVLCDNNLKLTFDKIEIINDISLYNRPYVNVIDLKVLKYIKNNNIQIDVSISHIESIASATSIVYIKGEI